MDAESLKKIKLTQKEIDRAEKVESGSRLDGVTRPGATDRFEGYRYTIISRPTKKGRLVAAVYIDKNNNVVNVSNYEIVKDGDDINQAIRRIHRIVSKMSFGGKMSDRGRHRFREKQTKNEWISLSDYLEIKKD